jgi:DNA-binding GntR family transcriptional regulator
VTSGGDDSRRHPLSIHELDDIYMLRAIVEGYCASRAATTMEPRAVAHLAKLQAEIERVAATGDDVDALIRLNDVFHRTIAAGSGNRRAEETLLRVTDVPSSLKRAFWRAEHSRMYASVYHHEIIEAIRARDAVRAEAVMRSHVYAVKDEFVEQHRAIAIQSLIDEVTR